MRVSEGSVSCRQNRQRQICMPRAVVAPPGGLVDHRGMTILSRGRIEAPCATAHDPCAAFEALPALQQAAGPDPWLAGVLGGMRKLSGEVELLNFLGDALDDALVAHRLDRCAALLEALSVGDLPDDVALTALIVTRPAGLPLREVRARYADRVRSELAKRGWAAEDISLAVDCLF